jgi:PIN domain
LISPHGEKARSGSSPLRVLKFQGKLELLVPALIIEEFERNRPRSESAVTASVLDRLRQLRRELREYAGDKHEHIWLAETAQHIPLVNATAPQNFREIDELLRDGTILVPAESEYARAVQRGLSKQAPFTSDKNSVADALLIEIYASQIAGADSSDATRSPRPTTVISRCRTGTAASRTPTWPGYSTAPGHATPTR